MNISIPIKSMHYMEYTEQQKITRLCVRCGLLMLQYGAESAMVVDLTKRLGIALGVTDVQSTLSFNGLTLTTIHSGRCITTTRGTISQGINVNILIQIQQIIRSVEALKTREDVVEKTQIAFDNMDRDSYPPLAVAFFIGGSCSAFAYLNGGNLFISAVTFFAGASAMLIRIYLTKRYLNVFVSVIITAFIASLIGATTYYFDTKHFAEIAVSSSILLLIPSFPMINATSDILKGYLNMGIGRTVYTFMLVLSACVGIVMALILLQIQHWGV